jgi:hypothetical protein
MRTVCLLFLGVLTACAPFPAVDKALGTDAGPPPQLLPIDSLIAQGQGSAADPGPALAARAASLKARAAALQAASPPP